MRSGRSHRPSASKPWRKPSRSISGRPPAALSNRQNARRSASCPPASFWCTFSTSSASRSSFCAAYRQCSSVRSFCCRSAFSCRRRASRVPESKFISSELCAADCFITNSVNSENSIVPLPSSSNLLNSRLASSSLRPWRPSRFTASWNSAKLIALSPRPLSKRRNASRSVLPPPLSRCSIFSSRSRSPSTDTVFQPVRMACCLRMRARSRARLASCRSVDDLPILFALLKCCATWLLNSLNEIVPLPSSSYLLNSFRASASHSPSSPNRSRHSLNFGNEISASSPVVVSSFLNCCRMPVDPPFVRCRSLSSRSVSTSTFLVSCLANTSRAAAWRAAARRCPRSNGDAMRLAESPPCGARVGRAPLRFATRDSRRRGAGS
mmetsp:Transcript_20724/g.52502  ORF Transcript_20724/g.52502 Transcript_20724/m.52502 type:complete len:380 (+) Transcript_20724:169-1308(+)